MSVRDGLLALLRLGPAYGSQLYAEFTARTPHRGKVNVGQIYATLDRLKGRRLVVIAGATPDGLPLYELTATGTAQVGMWMTRPDVDALPDWTEMLDQVLIALTIDREAGRALARGYREWWLSRSGRLREEAESAELDAISRLASLAAQSTAEAALSWLDSVDAATADTATDRPFADAKPRRGRPRER